MNLVIGEFAAGVCGDQGTDFGGIYFFTQRVSYGRDGGGGIGSIRGFDHGHSLGIVFLGDNRRRHAIPLIRHGGQRNGDHAGNDNQEGEKHFRDRSDEGRIAGGGHVLGCHRALDDEEIGTPVAEAQHETEAKNHGKKIHAHGIGGRSAEERLPGAGPGVFRKAIALGNTVERRGHLIPAADIFQAEVNHRGKTENDHEKLEHLGVNRRR